MPTWPDKTLDNLMQTYWTLKYVGLAAIPRSEITRDGVHIRIPAARVPPGHGLYVRARRDAEQRAWLATQEEYLNHVTDIAFAIAPDALIARCLLAPLGIADDGPFDSLGREVAQRYGWRSHGTQHDGLFVGPRSVTAVELKIGARTSRGQLAKYLALLLEEERASGPRPQVGLLYVVRPGSEARAWRDLGLTPGSLADTPLEALRMPDERWACGVLDRDPAASRALIARARLAVIGWDALTASLAEVRAEADTTPGGQTLARLIDGLVAQIDRHLAAGR